MAEIHPSAIVDPKARLGEGVRVGPYCVIGPEVELGADVELVSHVVVAGYTSIGAGSRVYPFASLGHPPQDLKYKGAASRLLIGKNCVMITRIGDNGLFMNGIHIAHDCQVGNNVIMASNATLGGHVRVGDHAFLGGLSAVHQFVRIGPQAMIGGMTGVEADVIPFGLVMGDRARLQGLNMVGLKRRGFSRKEIHELRTAYRLLFAQEGTMAERLEDVASLYAQSAPVMQLVDFIRSESSRSICLPKQDHAA
jgi:UDP-N-acetylglucosamine acyltransferase